MSSLFSLGKKQKLFLYFRSLFVPSKQKPYSLWYAHKLYERNIKDKHNMLKTPNSDRQTRWLFTEELTYGLPRNNSNSEWDLNSQPPDFKWAL